MGKCLPGRAYSPCGIAWRCAALSFDIRTSQGTETKTDEERLSMDDRGHGSWSARRRLVDSLDRRITRLCHLPGKLDLELQPRAAVKGRIVSGRPAGRRQVARQHRHGRQWQPVDQNLTRDARAATQ